MNIALIFAGGTGQRMTSRSKPKQFLEIHGKPIIMFTLDFFENHPQIDDIIVVCLESWISKLHEFLRRYDIKKVKQVVPGGATGHESIYNGLRAMDGLYRPEDIVLIHDGVRPLITDELISANIESVKTYGTGITSEPAAESVLISEDGLKINSVPNRDGVFIAKAPQSFHYGFIWNLHKRARADGILSIDSSHLLNLYGQSMNLVKSTPNNIKIATPADYYIFRALYDAIENQQILGY